MTEEEAKKAIKEAGLKLTATLTEEDTTKNDGEVLKQSLNAGDEVKKDSNITITVNKIEQLVTGTITVNLKSILGDNIEYTETTDDETGEVTKTVKSSTVKIVAGSDTIYSKKIPQDTTNITATVKGKGNIIIKIYVDDTVISDATTTMNLNQTTTLTIGE